MFRRPYDFMERSFETLMAANPSAAARAELVEEFLRLRPRLQRHFAFSKPASLREELAEVTLHQLEAVLVLERGALAMRELARELEVTESAATALADRLVRLGLVERHADPTDLRLVRLALSPKAERLAADMEEHRRSTIGRALEPLSDGQLCQLIDLLDTLLVAEVRNQPSGEPRQEPREEGSA